MIDKPSIAVIILNFNSAIDTIVCINKLIKQDCENFHIILVDNQSTDNSLNAIKQQLNDVTFNEPFSGVAIELKNKYQITFIEAQKNKGYSAGNNLGIKWAGENHFEAVLILNPDIVIENSNFITLLANCLFSSDNYVLAGPKIIGLHNENQNPLKELAFWDEVLWFKSYFAKFFKKTKTQILSIEGDQAVSVPKVSGSCLMIKTGFLRSIGYLDEEVFMYSEEAILAAQVQKANKQIVYCPKAIAFHNHDMNKKERVKKRLLMSIKSRNYYLTNYSGYNWLELNILKLSYVFLKIIYRFK